MYLNKINDKIADTIHIGIKDLQIKKIEIENANESLFLEWKQQQQPWGTQQ